MDKIIKGFKVFNHNWICKDLKYKVGQIYSMDETPKCCERGFHFCVNMVDCFQYYDFDSENKVAEVEALGEIDTDGIKTCTNKLKIIREIPWDELLDIVNEGKSCTGHHNTGNYNSGNYNSGNRNSGYGNTGDYNTGNYNAGYHNTGDYNTGYGNTDLCNTGNYNIGSCNTGNRNIGYGNTGNGNIGDYNSGNWNITSFSSGAFNTEDQKIILFNKPSQWTHEEWANSDAKHLLDKMPINKMPRSTVEWVFAENMTDEEKEKYPTYKTTDGYLKISDGKECCQIWWDNLLDEQKEIIKSIPNFDAKIFKQITGIKTESYVEGE